MQINIALDKTSRKQAEILRKAWYPDTTPNQIRDSFLFNECLDRFNAPPTEMIKIIANNEGNEETEKRMITIKAESYERLKTIAASIERSCASTFRAIIAYSIENLDTNNAEVIKKPVSASQLLNEKIMLLETLLEKCSGIISEIKNILGKR